MKYYAHFDHKVHWKRVRHIVEDPERIAKHGFYPFIHYTQEIVKYNKNAGRKPPKPRKIFYSAHIDRYIYQFYAYQLNRYYNKRVVEDGTNKCAIAYRNNLHKSNIHFAKEVFDFIRKQDQAYIIVGDFTNFFDCLDHTYLKSKLCELLKVKKLPNDYYKIFKSITQYSYFDLKKLLKISGLTHKELNQRDRVIELKDFKLYKKECLRRNKNNFGIPQGSAISAVLSNIYMLEFDKKINDFVTSRRGMYRRYSDDFVIIIPQCDGEELKKIWDYIYGIIREVEKLELQPDKTKVFEYNYSQTTSCNDDIFEAVPNGKDIIDYLGFSLKGNVVTIRDKTIAKYYYRMYKKIDTIVKNQGITKYGNKIPMDPLYKKYSFYGAKPTRDHPGNFLTYVNRAKKIFGPNEAIERGTKKHWGKLQKRLNGSTTETE